jgi:hypothetical protein
MRDTACRFIADIIGSSEAHVRQGFRKNAPKDPDHKVMPHSALPNQAAMK